MLNTVTSTTPGPNVYSKVGTLENDDPNKHFGFLSKSDRFQTASTLPDEENDASGRNSPVEAAFRRPLPKEFRGEKEEITKLKKEMDRIYEQHERSVLHHDKEISNLQEKLFKLDAQLQQAIKEKNSANSLSQSREKELIDLQKTHNLLKSKLEKAEKIGIGYHEKASQVAVLQKKIEELERNHNKQKISADRKTEIDILIAKLKKITLDFDLLSNEKTIVQNQLAKAKKERNEIAHKYKHLNATLVSVKEESASNEIKMSDKSNEISKLRDVNLDQTTEFRSTVQLMKTKTLEMEEEHQRVSLSFEKQKTAYLDRINQLERELNQHVDMITQKDLQISEIRQIHNSLKEGSLKSQSQISEYDNEISQLRYRLKIESENFNAEIENLQMQIDKLISERDLNDNNLRGIINDLKREVIKHEAKYNLLATKFEHEMAEKDKTIAIFESNSKDIKSSYDDLESKSIVLKSSISELEKRNKDLIIVMNTKSTDSKDQVCNLTESLQNAEKNAMDQSIAYSLLVKESAQTILEKQKELELIKNRVELQMSTNFKEKKELERQLEELKYNFKETNDKTNLDCFSFQQELTSTKHKYHKRVEEHEILERDFSNSTIHFETRIAEMQTIISNCQSSSEVQVKELRFEKQKLQSQNESLDSKKRSLESEIIRNEKDIKMYKVSLDVLKIEKDKLVVDFEMSRSSISDLEEKLLQLNNTYMKQSEGNERTQSDFQSRIVELNSRISILENNEQEFLIEHQNMTEKLCLEQLKRSEMMNELNTRLSDISRLQDQLSLYRKAFTEQSDTSNHYQNRLVARSDSEIDFAIDYQDILQTQLNQNEKYILELEMQNKYNMSAASLKIFESENMVIFLDSQINSYETSEVSLHNIIKSFINSLNSYENDYSNLSEKYTETVSNAELVSNELSDYKDKCCVIQDLLLNEKARSANYLTYAHQLSEQLENNYSKLLETADEVDYLEDQLEAANYSLKIKDDTILNMETIHAEVIEEVNENIMRLKYTVQSQDKRLIEAAELLVAANSNIDEHELNSTNKNFELAQVSNSLNLANEKLSRSEIAINDLNGQITTLTLTIKTTETDSNETIACLNGNIATQQKHLTQLEVKHDALKDSNLSMKDKLTTLFEENTRLSEKFKKSEADLEIAEMNFIHKERSLSDLNTRYSELSTDYIELKSHSVELENTVSNLNEDIEIAASKTEMIEIELTAKSSKIDSLYLAESELQSELSSINEKNCLLEKDVLFSNEKLKESQLCINELRSESSDLTAANQQYQSNLNSKIIEFSNLQEEYFSNTKQLLHLKDEKSRVEYDLSSSQDFLAECEISLASAREAALNAESLRKNSEENYKFQKEKNCNLEITLTQTRSILDEKASEITILNHNYQIQGKNYESQLDVKCIELNAQCQKLGDLTTKIQQLDRELQDSKLKILSRDNESKDMQLKIDGLHNKIKLRDLDTDNQITEMKNEHQILLQSFADKEKDLKKSEVELNSYNQELTDKIEMQASTFKRNISELEDKYNGTIKSKEKCLASAQNKCSHYALELEKLRDNTKKEFMEKNIEISQLKAKIENDLAISGSIIRDITTKLAEKSKDLKQAEIDKIDAKNNVAMIELKLTNEVTSNEIQIRSLDGKLKDCNKQMMKMNEKLHIYENENLITKEAYKKLELEMKELEDKKLKYKKDNQIQTEERKMYENRIAEVEAQVNTWTNNSEELKLELEASKRDLVETEARFNSQLKILQDRGTLNETEVKKIGDMNALLFGHTNSKQKIKHVAQIKEENVKLRTTNLTLTRREEDLKRQLMNLTREAEVFRGVGNSKSLKLNRQSILGTPFKPKSFPSGDNMDDNFKENASSNVRKIVKPARFASTPFVPREPKLEDFEVAEGPGGISFNL